MESATCGQRSVADVSAEYAEISEENMSTILLLRTTILSISIDCICWNIISATLLMPHFGHGVYLLKRVRFSSRDLIEAYAENGETKADAMHWSG